ncbi:ICE-like protease (caspase) p20 domain protein [Ceratobasidium sp. AG-Ba]|nr:ICE-like protease (caspase) p20 domain protein [Ceratobasidium sp. AG-Ba]
MHYELQFSFVFSTGSPQPTYEAPTYVHRYCFIAFVALLSALLFYGQRMYRDATDYSQNRPDPTMCQFCSHAPAPIHGPRPLPHGRTQGHAPVTQAQAPEPPANSAGLREEESPSSSSPPIHKIIRGSSALVVQPPDSNSAPPNVISLSSGGATAPVDIVLRLTAAILMPENKVISPILEDPRNSSERVAGPGIEDSDMPSPNELEIDLAPAEQSRSSPLRKTLVGHDLNRVPAFVVLGVGVGDQSLPGPAHDLDLLSAILPDGIFYPIKGTDATREAIHQQLRTIFNVIQDHVLAVLYFTGHSNGSDFMLHNGDPLTVATLLDWIYEIRRETGKRSPVFIAFDHCRDSLDLPRMPSDKLQDIYIVWACSPLQTAFELKLDDAVPYSEFLKAAFLTMTELLSYPPDSQIHLLERLSDWMSLGVKVHRGIVCKNAKCENVWVECRCRVCFANGLCYHPNRDADRHRNPIQTPTGWFWDSQAS